MVHLDVEDFSEELLRQQSYVMKNQLGHPKPHTIRFEFVSHPSPVCNGGILRSKAPRRGLWMPELVLYGIRLLAKRFLGKVLDIEVDQPGSGSDRHTNTTSAPTTGTPARNAGLQPGRTGSSGEARMSARLTTAPTRSSRSATTNLSRPPSNLASQSLTRPGERN